MSKEEDIISKLEEAFTELTGDGQPLAAVYVGLPNAETASYPYAAVEIGGANGKDERLDTASNYDTTPFVVYVVFNKESGEDNLLLRMSVLNAVKEKFRSAAYVDTLDGLVQAMNFSWAAVPLFDTNVQYSGFRFVFECKYVAALG